MKKMLALTLALGMPRRKTRRPIPLRKPLRWTFPPWKT